MLTRPSRLTQALAIPGFLFSWGCASHERPLAASSPASASGNTVPAPGTETTQPAAKPLSRQQESRRNVEAANDLVRRGQYDEAEHLYRLALEAEPNSMEDRKSTRLNSSHVAISYA